MIFYEVLLINYYYFFGWISYFTWVDKKECNRFGLVDVEGNFCTELRISVLAYWAPKSTCKEGTLNWPIAFAFGFVRSGFCVWDVRNKGNKKKDLFFIFYFFLHQTEILLKDQSSTKTNKKSKTNTDLVFNTKYRATQQKI